MKPPTQNAQHNKFQRPLYRYGPSRSRGVCGASWVMMAPQTYRRVKSLVGLSTWFPFYVRRQVLWISVMRSGN